MKDDKNNVGCVLCEKARNGGLNNGGYSKNSVANWYIWGSAHTVTYREKPSERRKEREKESLKDDENPRED